MQKTFLMAAILGLSLSTTAVVAEEKMDHSGHGNMEHGQMDHGKTDHGKMEGGHAGHGEMKAVEVKPGTEASGTGVLNSVDTSKGMVNLTHEPMPELGWPTMTMDLPVSKRVDLSAVKPGENIDFTLKLGRDKQYRVMEMTPAK